MSEENFLARWARRKRAVEEAASSSPERSSEPEEGEGAHAGTPASHPLSSRRLGPSPEGREEEPAAEPLPAIEDIDATSDITAFLREGVPEALKQAALRRVWALDPAIRDFVSPAEYAWDFNDPGSMAGFSSSVKAMDLTGFFSGEAVPAEVPPVSASMVEEPTASAALPPVSKQALPKRVIAASGDDCSARAEREPAGLSEAAGESDPPHRRHGGALPR